MDESEQDLTGIDRIFDGIVGVGFLDFRIKKMIGTGSSVIRISCSDQFIQIG
jgi:hypothetical protein